MSMKKPRKGKLLLSEPFMYDPNFKRTVILLCEHHEEEGSIGLILNKQLDMNLSEIIADISGFDAPLFYGGPVGQDSLHFLHNYGNLIEGSTYLGKDIYWNGDFEQLKTYINTSIIQPQNIRFYLGYSGWDKEQLAGEMKEDSWIVAPNQSEYVFSDTSGQLWRKVLRDMGKDNDHYRIMSHFPDYPSLN